MGASTWRTLGTPANAARREREGGGIGEKEGRGGGIRCPQRQIFWSDTPLYILINEINAAATWHFCYAKEWQLKATGMGERSALLCRCHTAISSENNGTIKAIIGPYVFFIIHYIICSIWMSQCVYSGVCYTIRIWINSHEQHDGCEQHRWSRLPQLNNPSLRTWYIYELNPTW